MIAVLNPLWFALLGVAAVLLIGLRLLVKDGRRREKIMGWAGILVCVYLFAYKYFLSREPSFDFVIWHELPLNLCNLAGVCVAVGMLADCRPLKAFAYLNCTIGTMIALLFPEDGFDRAPFFSACGIGYWGFHFLVLFVCVGTVAVGGYRPRFKDILWALGLVLACAGVMHGVNLIMRGTVYPGANYFYTFGLPGNALADRVFAILPIPFLWLFPMLVPAAAAQALLVALTLLWQRRSAVAAMKN